jgi:glycosyltransferase involved in cell wall biosynthesis
VVATDLPGVRQPVLSTGLGKIVPIKDSDSLSEAVIKVLQSGKFVDSEIVNVLSLHYAPETIAREYESLYKELIEAQ